MLALMYRDESEAARLRIATLEAKLAERDAMLSARDAEISELTSHVERLDPAAAARAKPQPQRLAPILIGAMTLLLATSSAISLGMRPRGRACASHHREESRATTGIAACDEYLYRVQLCVSHLDPAVRDAMSASLRGPREAWWSAGATPAGRDKLRVSCEQALDGLAVSPLCE